MMLLFVVFFTGFYATQAKTSRDSRGSIIWREEFDTLDTARWKHLVRFGWNNEFQYYTDRRENSYVKNGKLYIKPTLTADRFGEDFLYNGTLDLTKEGCNDTRPQGCKKNARKDGEIINPIQSARLFTKDSFSFTYGIIEISAKMPKRDWLWPAIWMLPTDYAYGNGIRSGEIDIIELRGNANLTCNGNKPFGRQRMEHTIHWGPDDSHNAYEKTNWEYVKNNSDFSDAFHVYRVEWRPNGFKFFVDDHLTGEVTPPPGGFWELGNFGNDNIWKSGSRMAPFDKNFYLIVNVAVGGSFFLDGCLNANYDKPWIRNHRTQMKQFWESKRKWLPTWHLEDESHAMQVDWIHIYALESDNDEQNLWKRFVLVFDIAASYTIGLFRALF